MRHATAKFHLLVHRFGMISVGLHAREFFEINFRPFLDPRNRGYFEGGADTSAKNLRRQSSSASPIFSRTERVLAKSSATLRESCSTEIKRIWPVLPKTDP